MVCAHLEEAIEEEEVKALSKEDMLKKMLDLLRQNRKLNDQLNVKEWPTCTYLNKQHLANCEMCSNPKAST